VDSKFKNSMINVERKIEPRSSSAVAIGYGGTSEGYPREIRYAGLHISRGRLSFVRIG
jgi:hypothetical protein